MVASHNIQLVTIQRPVYEQEQLHKDFEYQRRKSCGKDEIVQLEKISLSQRNSVIESQIFVHAPGC